MPHGVTRYWPPGQLRPYVRALTWGEMDVLPKRPVGAYEWAHAAWKQSAGLAITVPFDALQRLLDAYVEAATLRAALERRVKVTVETTGESAEPAQTAVE
jgi:hypothetical protein